MDILYNIFLVISKFIAIASIVYAWIKSAEFVQSDFFKQLEYIDEKSNLYTQPSDWTETEKGKLIFWKRIKKVSVHTLFPLSIFVSLALFAN